MGIQAGPERRKLIRTSKRGKESYDLIVDLLLGYTFCPVTERKRGNKTGLRKTVSPSVLSVLLSLKSVY